MFVIRPYGNRNAGVSEDGEVLIRFRGDSTTLDILLCPVSNIWRGVTEGAKELSLRVLVEHAFAERAKLLPLEPSVLIIHV